MAARSFFYYDNSHKGISIAAKLVDEKSPAFLFSYTTFDDRREETESLDEIFEITARYERGPKESMKAGIDIIGSF